MAETKTLAATVRGGSGKGAARSVRRAGRVPGVIYGGGEPPKPIALNFKELNQLIYAGHFLTTIFELDIEGAKEKVIPRDYQLDVVKDTPLHVDFLRLKAGSRLRVEVPVHFINQETCPGIKRGGSLNVVRHTVEMWVPAESIPEFITADLQPLDFNDSLHISAIKLPPGCTPTIANRDFTVASITPPTVMVEEAAAAGSAPADAKAAAAPAKAAAAPAKGGAAPAKAAAAPAKGGAAPAKGGAPAKK